MTPRSAPSPFRRWLAALLSLLMGLGPIATPAYGAITLLADQPLNITIQAKPNIVLTVDDSTSMLFDFLPDYIVNSYCRDGTGKMNAPCGFSGAPVDAGSGGKYISVQYIWEQANFPFPAYGGAGFDASGPGAGCNLVSVPPTCSGGISPGALPGILTYPAASGSPSAGKPYEYWLLWPAPVHNSAFNNVYYDPLLTYEPPSDSAGVAYPQMDAAGTTNWTKVPADAWATTITLVDLTAKVTVGNWCNSDWTQGNDDGGTPFVTNPGHCRTNGVIAAASAGSPAATGDYMYPWLPVGITQTAAGYNGATDYYWFNSKVDVSTAKISPLANATVTASWGTAQDQKYFYENENVLWCDITSPDWPQTGPTLPQTCNNKVNSQVCNANPVQPTCSGAVAGVCGGGTAAGVCNGAAVSGNCNGFIAGVCAGNQAGVCNGQPGVCTAPAAGACSVNASCTAGTPAACNGTSREACVGGSAASCNNIVAQTCNGGAQSTCNPVAQTCNGAQAQTCVNIQTYPPNPATCTSAWVPAGCNLDPNPEGSCVYTTTCPPPQTYGNCSVQTGTQCTSNAQCPFINGTCSVAGNVCTSNADCNLKKCAANGAVCTQNTDCPITGGTCSGNGAACTITGGVSTCPAAGNCNNAPFASCTSSATCPAISPHCATTVGTNCPVVGANSASCPVVPNSGTCNNPPNAACTTAATCPSIGAKCSNAPATNCANAAVDCPKTGTCSNQALACNANVQCPAVGPKKCTNNLSPNFGLACNVAADCDKVGVCTNNLKPANTPCTLPAQCTVTGKCTNAGPNNNAACAVNANPSVPCQTAGSCTTGNIGAACTVAGNTAQCAKNGTCSNNGAIACTVANQAVQCAATNGSCTAGLVGQPCAAGNNAACNKPNVCGSSQNNGTTCNPANIPTTTGGACIPNKGTCSVSGALCATAADCALTGFCSIQTAQVCLQNSDCANQPGPMDPRNAKCDTTGVSGNALTTLLADANGTGKTCRRNNHGYVAAGVAASQFNYPSGKFTTPVSGEITSGLGCHATDRYASVARHYWKTSVEWCDQKITTPGDEWLGYGTPSGGTCQSFRDGTHVFPRFYQFGAAAGTDNYTTAAFQREDLDIALRASATFDHGFDALGNAVVRNFDEEMTNYANWFAYYRTRILAVKTVTSLAFKELDTKFRVGFHTLSNGVATPAGQADPSKFVNVDDFTAVQKGKWFNELFAIQVPLQQETPNLDALMRVGEYFKDGTSAALVGSTDPIILSCQKNWHMLFTDGFTNQNALPSVVVGDQDDKIPTLPLLGTPMVVPGLTPGQPWPGPYREDPSGKASDAASDYSMNYWATDLRTSGATGVDNVPTSLVDPASWQHLNFAAMSLGTQGKLPVGNQSTTETQLAAGSLQWPQPQPNVYKPDASGVDDLWHAALNGRGRFVNAQSADELKLGMGQILQDITNQAGARAGAGLQSSTISSTNHVVYRARFEPGWGGSLSKIEVDPTTGIEGAIDWDASTQLATQLLVTVANPQPWLTSRRIVTMSDAGRAATPQAATPFLWANLSAGQQDSFYPGKPVRGAKILDFLRGDASNEGTKLGNFRVRSKGAVGENFLGDIVNSQALYVGPPNASYLDIYDPGYSTFKSLNSGRQAMVYVGANDGMFHAFEDLTGNETFAYIPHDLYRSDKTGLGALAYQDGALPPFRHHYYVDSTPRAVDVDIDNPPTGASWRSLLVAGLGKGGKSYYAIDVTQPAGVTDETIAAKKVLWEYTDADMGYTYGRPMITKTHAFGGRWVVIVPSGYDNATGEGKIFIVDAKDGTWLKTMGTGSGSPGSPSGLAHIAGYTRDYHNQLVEQIYAGDLDGNLWRFDLSDSLDSNWIVEKLATLTDAGGAPQPVTIPPQIEIDLSNGVDRYVMIGTGRMLDDSDLTVPAIANQTQSFYSIRDGTGTKPLAIVTAWKRADFDALPDPILGLPAKPDKGWYEDLGPGQRVVTPIQAAISVVGYIGTSPQTDPCLTGQPANLYVRQFSTGESLLTDPLTGFAAGTIYSPEGGVGIEIVSFADNASSSTGPDIRVAVTMGTTGDVKFFKIKLPNILNAHRMSWRLLGQ